jgi:hypothetical protein
LTLAWRGRRKPSSSVGFTFAPTAFHRLTGQRLDNLPKRYPPGRRPANR